jgi:hypothetical protein
MFKGIRGEATRREDTTMSDKSTGMDDVIQFIERCADGGQKHACKAMFYFLYKEILVNRIGALESAVTPNHGAIEHNEKLVNELNLKLMEAMK